ncbi:LamG-like jellyroll fold domain-containing protein [Bythopirellula goksoeyrii]|uniref:Ice-binding protein C-terminal domain-containing protein n=1 Tax=Bythopirellula goksoeyrii TaxID=1400387 RepID=A0A5B9QTY7_9BACT|nr:LamG-like jellyroll fold domain-containing protein [Bythopirellula goksoeyrii]QEG37393.1 hypothetical protein Pr1d_47360 [Bythopirellula goksoeyrii]
MTYRNYLATALALASTFVLLAVCSIPTYAVTRDDALAARWKLGEDATLGGVTGVEVISVPDATGNLENTLTQLIDADHTLSTNDPQRVPGFNPGGFATHFDGGFNGVDFTGGGDALITQTADLDTNASLDFADGPFSISFWTQVSQDNEQFVKFFAARDPSDDQLFYESEVFFEGPNFITGVGIRTPTGEGGVGTDYGGAFDFNGWNLITIVRDRPVGEDPTIAIFHNGAEVAREFDGSGSLSIPGPFGIGGENGAAPPNSDINAIIDEFRLYNVALTPAEVAEIYNGGDGDVAASSELLFLWGNRGLTGSWGVSGGWQSQDPPALPMDTADIPVSGEEFSDPVQVLMGTVSVDTGDQGAWSLQIDAGAGLNVASGNSLLVLQDVTTAATSSITVAGTLTASTIDAQGTVTFADGVLAVGDGTIAAAATSSDATIQNSGELSVGQMTVGNGDALVKQSGGTLILDQSGGANSFAAGSSINVEGGALAGVSDATNNALGSAAVNMDGGNLVLSSSQAGAAAFDVAVAVNSDGAIRAAQIGTGALANETVTLGGTNGVSLATDVVATLETADGYTLNLAGDVAGDGRLAFASGAQVNVTGAVTAKVVQFSGDTSGITGIGNVAPGEAYLFAPTEDVSEMSVGFAISGNSDVIVEGQVNGSVALSDSSYTGTTIIRRGTFRTGGGGGGPIAGDFDVDSDVDGADFLLWQRNPSVGNLGDWQANYGGGGGGGGLPAASLLQFEGVTPGDLAVLESADATFERNIGTGAGEVTWAGSGGFASKGGGAGGLTVTLKGGAALSFSSATAGFNGHALQLGSPTADGKVELTNDLNLENAERVVQIADNPNSDQDFVEISGDISSTAGGADVLTVTAENGEGAFQNGLLVLSGSNSMSKLRIKDGSVDVSLPAGTNLEFGGNEGDRPAVLVGSGTANLNIGSAGGEASWAGPGGFGARGGDLTVTLEGGATLAWEDADTGFNGAELQLGSNHSDGTTTFTNSATGFNGAAEPADRFIRTFGNPLSESDEILITGDFVDGFNELLHFGKNSRVVFSGDMTTSGFWGTFGGFGPFVPMTSQISATSNVSIGTDAGVFDAANLFVNTQNFDVAGGLFVEAGGASLGGNGKISVGSLTLSGLALIAPGSTLRPGPDFDAVGTLEFVLEEPGNGGDFETSRLLMLTESTFEMEFINDGGLQHDSVNVDGVLAGPVFAQIMLGEGAEDVWNLELEALNDVSGLVTAGAEYDLFTWNNLIDLVINGENITAMGANMTGDVMNVAVNSTDFTGGTVHYEILSDFSGRVYVTGLTAAALAASTAVPEPASWAMAAVAVVGMVARRRRKLM